MKLDSKKERTMVYVIFHAFFLEISLEIMKISSTIFKDLYLVVYGLCALRFLMFL